MRFESLLVAMAAARCTPAVVLRSQSAPARSVLMFFSTMALISAPSCRSFSTASTLLVRDRARMTPITTANRLPMEILLRNMLMTPEDQERARARNAHLP